MKLKDIKMGIHTIELYAGNLKYHQIQKTIDHLVEQRSIQRRYSDPYSIDRHLKSKYLMDEGVRMRLYQSHNKSNGISFAVTPSTLLAKCYQPLKLYRPTKANVDTLQEALGELIKEVHLCDHEGPVVTPEELSLSRMDLTADLYFIKSADISSLIRLFRKSMLPRHYKRGELEGKQDYFFQLATKKISFKVYDKIYELEQNDRCPKEHRKQKVLRLEVSMKREAFLDRLNLNRKDDLYTMLKAGYDHIRDEINYFLDKLFPSHGVHLPYPEAKKAIQKSKLDPDTRKQMLFLLEKTSRGAGLDTAAQKWAKTYNIVNARKFHSLMKQFDTLHVNPITLTTKDKTEIPSLRTLIHLE